MNAAKRLRKYGYGHAVLQALHASNPELAQTVVLTLLTPPEQHTNPSHRRRFRKEYEVSARQQRKSMKSIKRYYAQHGSIA